MAKYHANFIYAGRGVAEAAREARVSARLSAATSDPRTRIAGTAAVLRQPGAPGVVLPT